MTTAELIALLRKTDPEGNCRVIVSDGDGSNCDVTGIWPRLPRPGVREIELELDYARDTD